MIDDEPQRSDNLPDAEPLVSSAEPLPPVVPRGPVWGYKDLLVVAGLAIPCFIIMGLLGVIAALVFRVDRNLVALPVQFAAYLAWFILIAMHLSLKYNVGFWSALGWRWQPRYILPALASGLVLGVAVGLAGVALKTPKIEANMIQELLNNPVTRVMVVISATTIGPICEELFFRGFLLPLFERTFGVIVAIMLSALPFALLHGPQYKWTWQLVLLIFGAGCAFGWSRVRTGSTATSAVMHAAYNSFFFITYFAGKGMDV